MLTIYHFIRLLINKNTQLYYHYVKTIFCIFTYTFIVTQTALLTSKQTHVYCKLCIAIYFNEILV